jgi:hypothetical protein
MYGKGILILYVSLISLINYYCINSSYHAISFLSIPMFLFVCYILILFLFSYFGSEKNESIALAFSVGFVSM